MEPSTEHEREIALAVAELAGDVSYSLAIIYVSAALSFTMSTEEATFLVNYLQWKMNNRQDRG